MGIRSLSDMKSSDAFRPEERKFDQSVGRGVKTTLSPSLRMKTSRTDSGNRYSSGIVTVCERLFHPTRAVGFFESPILIFKGASSKSQYLLWQMSR